MSQEQAVGSNNSDFDDDDFGSLLEDDDDDDIFAKKVYGSSSEKKASTYVPASLKKAAKPTEHDSPVKIKSGSKLEKRDSKLSLTKRDSKESLSDYDALNAFTSDSGKVGSTFLKDSKTSSPVKSSVDKGSTFLNDETNFLEELGLGKLSLATTASGNHTDDSLLKAKISDQEKGSDLEEEEDDDDDILKTLGLDTEDKNAKDSPKKSGGSFLDDFLKKLSPQRKASACTEEKKARNVEKKGLEEDEDILGTYIPTTPKESEVSSAPLHSSPKRKSSLFKQVSFKDVPEVSPEIEMQIPKKIISPTKNINSSRPSSESKMSERPAMPSKRSEKMGSSTEDMDWLNFFKESPKKSNKIVESQTKGNISQMETKESSVSESRLSMRRRSSGAEWLGLSEPKSVLKNFTSSSEQTKEKESDLDCFASGEPIHPEKEITNRPKSTGEMVRPKRHGLDAKMDVIWNEVDGNKSVKNTKPTTFVNPKKTSDLIDENKSNIPQDLKLDKIKDIFEPGCTEPTVTTFKKVHIPETLPKNSHIATKQISSSEFISQTIATNVSQSQSVPSALIQNPSEDISLNQHSYGNFAQNAYNSMQLMLNNSMLERDQLIKSSETMKFSYEEKLKTLEALHKCQMKASEDAMKVLESSLKAEFEAKMNTLEENLKLVQNERQQMEMNFKAKLDTFKREHEVEVKRLKELHNQSITLMKQDHEEALNRLQRLKEQELEAVLSTQNHSRSLQQLSDQLEARAAELSSLQSKLEERNQVVMKEKQTLLDSKERDLKALQNRLQRQLEDSYEERARLQQLVLILESRLQKYTMEGEEDRFEVQQMKVRLTVQKKYLEEEHKLNQQQIEKEKEKLRLSQDSLLHEQKTVLLQLAQERQMLTQEKSEMEISMKKVREEEAKWNVRKLKEESAITAEKQALQQEENKLHFEKERLKQEFYQLERERDTLQREKLQIKNDREKINELQLTLNRKSSEVEEMAAVAMQEKEQGQLEHAAARRIKNEHQSKMQQYMQKMQLLMEKERQILMEKEQLQEEKIELENKNSTLCNKCKLAVDLPVSVSPPGITAKAIAPVPVLNGIQSPIQQFHMDPNLVVWYVTAQKDREYLQEELSFLRSLKESAKKK